ncbi:MAG: fungal specific transcription factor domain-containing protein [Terriglobus roseus]|nr:fungal specific transcription factor domain-containing protein [Terriglobus roseus]
MFLTSYVHNLLKRIDQLEEELSGMRLAKRHGDVNHEPISAFSILKSPSTRQAHDGQLPQHASPLSWLRHRWDQPHDAVADSAAPGSDLGQAAPEATYPTSKPGEPLNQGYLGAANSLTFCQVVLEQEDPFKQHQDLGSSTTLKRAESGTRWNTSTSVNDLADSWPQRYLGDHLVDCFIELCYPQYPFIHGPTFKRRYESMWTSRERQTDAWIAMVNSVFALGCQYSPNISPELGGEFFKKVTFLINFEGLGECTLESLQALILMSLYLQCSANLNHSWNVIGLAVRQAQSLGLHLQKTYQRSGTPLVREVQKRVWTASYVLDSASAMMLGRPPMISHDARALIEDIKLLDDDQIPTGRALPPSWPASARAATAGSRRSS